MIGTGLRILAVLAAAFGMGMAALQALTPEAGRAAYQGFKSEQQIALPDYAGDAMEPFITPDGRQMLFNSSNAPDFDTDLFSAPRKADGSFAKPAALAQANSKTLDGVASLDRDGTLYLISLRSYAKSLSTLYSASNGGRAAPKLVAGVSSKRPGIVQFDAEVAWDGQSLWVSEGRFSGKPYPDSARIVLARKSSDGFRYSPDSDVLLAKVNQGALNYAAAISRDGLELFFTRVEDMGHPEPVIMRAARSSLGQPFGSPQPVAGIAGHVEAPSLSADGLTLYYHKRIAGRFVLCEIRRQRR